MQSKKPLQSKEKLRLALEAAKIGIWQWSPETGQSLHDEGINSILGRGSVVREVDGQELYKSIHPDDRSPHRELVQSVLQEKKPFKSEFRIIRPNGEIRWVVDQGRPILAPNGDIEMVTGILTDITEIKETQIELEKQKEQYSSRTCELEKQLQERTKLAEDRASQLQMLVSQLATVEDRERRRLARILHDELQQLIVGAKYKIQLFQMKTADQANQKEINDIISLLDESVRVSRSLTSDLSPPILYDAGLVSALEWLGDRFNEKYGLRLKINRKEDLDIPSDDLQIVLFSFVKELLFNIVKHASSKEALLEMEMHNDDIVIRVIDHGNGFDFNEYRKSKKTNSFGLFGIEERLKAIGGKFKIQSSNEYGTTATICVSKHALPETGIPIGNYKPVNQKLKIVQKAEHDLKIKENGNIRILIADDHEMMREGLRNILNEKEELIIVAEAEDGIKAVELSERTKPDIIILDVSMPRMNGIEAASKIRDILPNAGIIGLSMHDDMTMATAMLSAGADDYLTKGGASEELIDTIFRLSKINLKS